MNMLSVKRISFSPALKEFQEVSCVREGGRTFHTLAPSMAVHRFITRACVGARHVQAVPLYSGAGGEVLSAS